MYFRRETRHLGKGRWVGGGTAQPGGDTMGKEGKRAERRGLGRRVGGGTSGVQTQISDPDCGQRRLLMSTMHVMV